MLKLADLDRVRVLAEELGRVRDLRGAIAEGAHALMRRPDQTMSTLLTILGAGRTERAQAGLLSLMDERIAELVQILAELGIDAGTA